MSEELSNFKNKLSDNKMLNQFIWFNDGGLDLPLSPLLINNRINTLSKVVLDEKISFLIQIDEDMANAMIDYAEKRATDGVSTRELALTKWHETSWHLILKKRIDKLRELRKEFDE